MVLFWCTFFVLFSGTIPFVSDSLFRFQQRFPNLGVRVSICATVVFVRTHTRRAGIRLQSVVRYEKNDVVLPDTMYARLVEYSLRILLLQVFYIYSDVTDRCLI